jgi:hypothetical protein
MTTTSRPMTKHVGTSQQARANRTDDDGHGTHLRNSDTDDCGRYRPITDVVWP